jgi:hypothetical protein
MELQKGQEGAEVLLEHCWGCSLDCLMGFFKWIDACGTEEGVHVMDEER